MGRWKSDLVIRYSCGQTTTGITGETINALRALDQNDQVLGSGSSGSSGSELLTKLGGPSESRSSSSGSAIARVSRALKR